MATMTIEAGSAPLAEAGTAPFTDVQLSLGPIRYREMGRGEPIVFVHGLLTNGALWRNVVPPLAEHYRCIVPDWPLGAHTLPLRTDATLTFPILARLVDEFLAALDLHDVTLVGNDTGGALCQFVVAAHPERVGRLVLTNCDAFDNFLPMPLRYVQWGAHLPGFVWLMSKVMPIRALQRLPITLGWATKRPIGRDVVDGYFGSFTGDAAIRRDLGKILRAISPGELLGLSERLAAFGKPVLLAWAPEDRLFPLPDAERLAELFPDARVREIPDAYALIPEDQPLLLAAAIDAFLRETDSRGREREERAAARQEPGRGAQP